MAHGGREDCWSEGATVTLVDAWGNRFTQLNRGNLRQKDWSDVADAVNDRQASLGKPRRTDVQCKNRIDTLKKKYKSEKSKSVPSPWPFFSQMDFLVGPAVAKKSSPLPLPAPPITRLNANLSFTVKPRNPNPGISGPSGGSSSRSLMSSFNSMGSSRSSRGYISMDEEEDEDDDPVFVSDFESGRKSRWDGLVECGGGSGGEGALGELARAIVKFAEVYERVESSKQQQMMELERKRMEFAKDLEFQRMQMFMEAQLELEKLKRPKYSSGSDVSISKMRKRLAATKYSSGVQDFGNGGCRNRFEEDAIMVCEERKE